MSASTVEHPKLNLRCPYCEGHLSVTMEEAGNGYMSYQVPAGFECSVIACGAEWSIEGELTHQPSFLLYPELYEKPTACEELAND